MSITLYDVTVPRFQQTIGALVGVLDKAADHCEANKIDPSVLVAARLFPDMFAFKEQIAGVLAMSVGALETTLVGKSAGPPPTVLPPAKPLSEYKADLTGALSKLAAVDPAQLNATEQKEVIFTTPFSDLKFTGVGFLMSLAMPNFYFHATTAYDILRHNGVVLGKFDFLGQIQLKS